MRLSLFILIFLPFLSSCEENIDAGGLSENTELISIYSYIAPSESTIKVQVGRVVSVFKPPQASLVIENAQVNISDSKGLVANIPFDPVKQLYELEIETSDFKIEEGKTYFLKVQLNGKVYDSKCRVPSGKINNEKIGYSYLGNKELNIFFQANSPQDYYIAEVNAGELNNGFVANKGFIESYVNDNVINFKSSFFEVIEKGKLITVRIAQMEELVYRSLLTSLSNENFQDTILFQTTVPTSNFSGDDVIGVFGGYLSTEKKIILE